MPIISKVSAKNFRCYRRNTGIELDQSTYLVGINNSGKTAMLSAIHCFFDSSAYKQEYLNKTDFIAKQEGFNRSEITISFDLTQVTGPARKTRMITKYGNTVDITKKFIFRETSKTIVEEYYINGISFSFDQLEKDIQVLLKSVSISYIHPQEGQQLLNKAQQKFKERLFNNWGRHHSVSERLNELQEQWDELRKTANSYLSSALTTSLRNIWPQSNTKVNLPERIRDIVAVSDISFRSSLALPEVTLTSQGTGAQSTILYQTHYILDSDRSLHQGMYFPIWLLEEPESFLHADIAYQLAKLLNSDEWLKSIQMVVSTHSPIMLAASSQNADRTRWVVFDSYAVILQKKTSDITNDDIALVGHKMGDINFPTYFHISSNEQNIFIEDKRPLTKAKFREAGIPVENELAGISKIRNLLEIISTVPKMVNGKIFCIVDNDKGKDEINKFIKEGHMLKKLHNLKTFLIFENTYIILLPEDASSEDLFTEYDTFLEGCCDDIFNSDYSIKDPVPLKFTRLVAAIRAKPHPTSLTEAKKAIKKYQEVKDLFWKKVDDDNLGIAAKYVLALKTFMDLK